MVSQRTWEYVDHDTRDQQLTLPVGLGWCIWDTVNWSPTWRSCWGEPLGTPSNCCYPMLPSDISILELYADVALFTETRAPQNTSTKAEITNRLPAWTFDDLNTRRWRWFTTSKLWDDDLFTCAPLAHTTRTRSPDLFWNVTICRRSHSLAGLGYSG